MEILKETSEKMIKFDTKLSKKEEIMLLSYAKKHILYDKDALINYAVNRILIEQVNTLKGNIKQLKEIKQHEKGYSSSKSMETGSETLECKSRNKNSKIRKNV